MKTLKYAILPLLLLISFHSFAGKPETDFKKLFYEVQSLLYNENYVDALPLLHKLDSLQPNNPNIQFQLGVCYYYSPLNTGKSVPFLKEAVKHITPEYKEGYFKEVGTPTWSYLFLGDAYHKTHEFSSALQAYGEYKKLIGEEDSLGLAEADYKIQVVNNAVELVKSPVTMVITNLGDKINSPYPDYKPVVSADESTLIFTSRRENSTGNAIDIGGRFFEDIYISENINGEWSEPRSIGENINTDDHEATVGLSADGQKLLVYKFLEGSGDIYMSNLIGTTWTEPEKVTSDVNLKSWESHASLSADGNLLFFTSDREGGYGGTDIYYCKKMPTGDWTLAQNMGPEINTPYDEDGAILHPDGVTFFFSSKGHNTMGGYDIMFASKQDDGKFGGVVNIGYPVNTTGDDVFYVPTTDGTGAYYSSFRADGVGDQDIYKMSFPEEEEKSLTVYKGMVRTKTGKVPEVLIEVTDVETGELIGTYNPNTATGKYLIVLQPGKNYDITYDGEGCFFFSDRVEVPEQSAYNIIQKAIDLDPLEVGQIIDLDNVFYEYDKATLQQESYTQLENIVEFMNDCPELKIEIEGHTDAKGDEDYNMKLSQARAETVVKYLVDQGIAADRLQARGFGESMPVAPNVNADGSDNPDGRAKNRRTEMKVLSIG